MDPLDAAFNGDAAVQPPEGGQGQPVAEPPAVQPVGQGQPGETTGLYDLSSITDPEMRSHVERIAKDIDRNVNSKLQEAAEYRKSWDRFSSIKLAEDADPINVQDWDPEGVGALLAFASELAQGGDTAREALTNLAASLEIDLGTAAPVADATADDPVAAAQARIDALEARLAAQDDAQQMAHLEQEALVSYQAEYAAVEQANGKAFSDEEKTQLLSLAKRFQADHDTPIKAAFELINSIAGKAETSLVNRQPTPPRAAEPAGRASTTVQPVDDWETAERLHRERNNASTHA